MKYAVLIDAGFVKTKLGSQASPLDASGVQAFVAALTAHPALGGMRLHRVYWYDAPPLDFKVEKPLQGGTVDFGSTALGKTNVKLHQELCKAPHFAMRSGYVAFRGWKIKKARLPKNTARVQVTAADLEPSVHQKGVDMRLGLDIAALTLKNHVGAIVLVAGDADFVPAMKFARREGAQLYLVTFGHTIRPEMLEHADLLLDVPVKTTTVAAAATSSGVAQGGAGTP